MNNKSFLDELNQLSKTKENIQQDKLIAQKKYCEESAKLTYNYVKDEIKDKVSYGNFTHCGNKKRVSFIVPVHCHIFGDGSYEKRFDINLKEISWIRKQTFFGTIFPHCITFNIELILSTFEYLKMLAANEGIICEAVKIRHKKKIYSSQMSGHHYKETVISYYELSDNKKYIEYDGGEEEYDLVVEGYIEY